MQRIPKLAGYTALRRSPRRGDCDASAFLELGQKFLITGLETAGYKNRNLRTLRKQAGGQSENQRDREHSCVIHVDSSFCCSFVVRVSSFPLLLGQRDSASVCCTIPSPRSIFQQRTEGEEQVRKCSSPIAPQSGHRF